MSSDTDTPTRKPLKLSSPGKLELKKTVDGGQVRQSFPHGRSKTVAVEVKKKRTYAPGAGGKMEVSAEVEAKPAMIVIRCSGVTEFAADHRVMPRCASRSMAMVAARTGNVSAVRTLPPTWIFRVKNPLAPASRQIGRRMCTFHVCIQPFIQRDR